MARPTASRRFVFTRSPGFFGISEGAATMRRGRAEPQNKEGESWTSIAGLSSESIRQLRNAVAVAEDGRGGDVRYLGEIDTTEAATRKLVTKLAAKYRRLTFCYEAGPTGYGLYRLIKKLGRDSGVSRITRSGKVLAKERIFC